MNKNAAIALSFLGGAVIGAVTTYFITKNKYQKMLENDIAPVRKEFEDYIQNVDKKVEEVKNETEKKVRAEYDKKKEEVKNLEKTVNDLDYSAQKKKDGPYLIEQGGEEFGGYMAVSLEYYADGVLLDDADVIDDDRINDLVGVENLALLDENRPLIWVRNEDMQVDYEIAYIDEDFYDEGN